MPTNDSMFDRILNEWLLWGLIHKPIVISKLNAGMNSDVYLLQGITKKFILKIFSNTTQKAILQSIKVQTLAAKNGLSAEITYSDPTLRYILMDYIIGQGASTIPQLAHDLKSVHQIKLDASTSTITTFNSQHYSQTYFEKLTDSSIKNKMTTLLKFKKLVSPSLLAFDSYDKQCLCHNDLVRENIIFSASNVFIDWDFSELNSPWFDIASVVHYYPFNKQQAVMFLASYWKNKSYDTESFKHGLCVVQWLDILWSEVTFGPHKNSSLDLKLKQLEYLIKH